MAGTFHPDGILESRGLEPLRGRSEIRDFLGGVTGDRGGGAGVKPVVRHNLTNVLITGLTAGRAQVSSYFTVLTHIGLDHFGRYRDTLAPDGAAWRIEHRRVSTDWAAPDSAIAHTPAG